MSIASTISRLGFGKFSDHPRVNRLFMTQLAILGFGVTTTLSPLARSYASLLTVVVALGLFDGLYVVLIAVLNTDIVGVHKLPAAIGSLYGVISFTLTLGPPFAGTVAIFKIKILLVKHTTRSFTLTDYFVLLKQFCGSFEEGVLFHFNSALCKCFVFFSAQSPVTEADHPKKLKIFSRL